MQRLKFYEQKFLRSAKQKNKNNKFQRGRKNMFRIYKRFF